MIRAPAIALALALSVAFAAPAKADQYDAIVKFNTLAAAKADPDVQKFWNASGGDWDRSGVIEVQVWRASQDVTGTDADGNPTVTHTYLPGLFWLISLPRLVPALRDNTAIQVVLNRDKCRARVAGCVIKSNVSNAVLQDIRISPTFEADAYPFGAFQ